MIEFTVSRVAVFICAAALMVAAIGAMNGIYDTGEDRMEDELAVSLAHMLDIFESSETDELVLDGPSLLPEGSMLKVGYGFVELHRDGRMHMAMTSYKGEFQMEWNETLRITRRRSRLSS